jgi:hypothetical protein
LIISARSSFAVPSRIRIVTTEETKVSDEETKVSGTVVLFAKKEETKVSGTVVLFAKKSKLGAGRTIHLQDDLFERIMVHTHGRGKNISEYVAWVLERQVPDRVPSKSKPVGETRPEVDGDVELERSAAGGVGKG